MSYVFMKVITQNDVKPSKIRVPGVIEVLDDKKRGLVARVERTGVVHDDEVGHVLGAYTRPWEWAE